MADSDSSGGRVVKEATILKTILDFGIPKEAEPDGNLDTEAFQEYQFFPEFQLGVVNFTTEQLNQTLAKILTILGNPDRMTSKGRLILFYNDLRRLIDLSTLTPVNDRYIVVGLYLLLRRKDPLGEQFFDNYYVNWSQGWEIGIPNDPYLLHGPRWIELADAIEFKVGRKVPNAQCASELSTLYWLQHKIKK